MERDLPHRGQQPERRRYIVIDADATSAIMNTDPRNWDDDQSSHPTPTHTGIPQGSGFNWKKSLMSAAPSVANVLRPQGEFAIIGPGGGVDVLRAVANGSPNVTGIEINPTIANDVMRGRYADYSYHLYELPQVHIHVQDGRSYVRNASAAVRRGADDFGGHLGLNGGRGVCPE